MSGAHWHLFMLFFTMFIQFTSLELRRINIWMYNSHFDIDNITTPKATLEPYPTQGQYNKVKKSNKTFCCRFLI